MRFRNTQLTAIMISVVLLAAGCTSSPTSTEKKSAAGDTVTVFARWTGAAKKAIDSVFTKCDAELNDVKIDVRSVPGPEYEVQLPITLGSSNPPDIYALWPGGRALFQTKNGLIKSISTFYNKKIAPIYSEGVNKGATEVDGKVYVMPFNVSPNAFYYRKDIFTKYGLSVPKTYNDFQNVLKVLKNNGETPIVLGSKVGWEPLFWFDYFVMRTAGPDFRARLMSGKESYTDPKVVKAMTMWGDLIKAGYFNEGMTSIGWPDMSPQLANGRAVMMLMGPWAVDSLSKAGLTPGAQFDSFPFPQIDPAVKDSAEGAMEGWATTGARDNANKVQEVLECFASTSSLTQYASQFTTLTPNPKVSLDVYPKDKQPFVAKWKEMSQDAVFQQNLELATAPPVTTVAKREFPRFLANPDTYMQVLEALDRASKQEYGN